MDQKSFREIAERLLRHPTAPYHEHAVRGEVEAFCREHGLQLERDSFGNVLARLWGKREMRPLVLAAHLDHPGFHIERRLSHKLWLASFRGGVPDEYFRRGIPVRLMTGSTPAQLGRRLDPNKRVFEIASVGPSELVPTFAVWGLDDCSFRNGRVYARACDDLIGVASVLATLADLKRARADVRVIGVLSRAEEVGFIGALALAVTSRPADGKSPGQAARTLPENALVISLETSRELPGVKMGQGVILRVGDKASIFDSAGTRFLGEVARELQKRNRKFRFQRALMSGGTCEATAYQEFGFRCAAVCVALGNYHNCGPRGRITAEHVSLEDACGMVQLLVTAAKGMRRYDQMTARLPKRLRRLLRQAQPALRKTA